MILKLVKKKEKKCKVCKLYTFVIYELTCQVYTCLLKTLHVNLHVKRGAATAAHAPRLYTLHVNLHVKKCQLT